MTATNPVSVSTYHSADNAHLSGMTTTAARPVAAPPTEDTDPLRPARGILLGVMAGWVAWSAVIGGVGRLVGVW